MLFVSSVQMTYAQYLKKIWDDETNLNTFPIVSAIAYDFDKDGNDEVAYLTNDIYSHSKIIIGKYEDFNFTNSVSSNNFKSPEILTFTIASIDNRNYIYTVMSDGYILTLNENLIEINRFYSGLSGFSDVICKDFDNDGSLELAVLTETKFRIYNLPDFSIEYNSNIMGGQQLVSGDYNGDGISDFCINNLNTKSYIINGSDYSLVWTNNSGFGSKVSFLDFDNDGQSELLAYNGNKIFTLYDLNSKSTIKLLYTTVPIKNWITSDYHQDGNHKIIFTDEENESVFFLDINSNLQTLEMDRTRFYFTTEILLIINKQLENKKLAVFHNYFKILDLQAGVVEYSSDLPFFSRLQVRLKNPDNYLYHYIHDRGFSKIEFNTLQEEKKYIFSTYEPLKAPFMIQSRSPEESELIQLTGNKVFIFDAESMDTLFAVNVDHANEMEISLVEDFNLDGYPEIILSLNSFRGYIQFDGLNYHYFKNEDRAFQANNFFAMNSDGDDQLELVSSENSFLAIYDNFPNINSILQTFNFSFNFVLYTDIEGLGHKNLVAVADTLLYIINPADFSVVKTVPIPAYKRFIGIANLDNTPQQEIIIADNALKVYNLEKELLFESDYLGEADGWSMFGANICDIGNDGYTDIILNHYRASYVFSAEMPSPDLEPPVVTGYNTQKSASNIPLNLDISVVFSEDILSGSLSEQQVNAYSGSDNIPVQISLDNNVIRISPITNWTPNSVINILIPNSLTDKAGNYLDGNRDSWGSHTSNDDLIISFRTTAKADTIGPIIETLTYNTAAAYSNAILKLQGTISDTLIHPYSAIKQIEYFVDVQGNDGNGTPVYAASLNRNLPFASFEMEIPMNNLSPGNHILFIHSKDAANNWGQIESVHFSITDDQADNWPTYGHDHHRTFCNSLTDLGPDLVLNWSKYIPDLKSMNPPIIADNKLFITYATQDNVYYIACYDLVNGDIIWTKQQLNNYAVHQIIYALGNIYFFESIVNKFPNLRCIRAADGTDVWSFSTGKANLKDFVPLYSNGNIYYPDSSKYISCIDASSGKWQWKRYIEPYSYCQLTALDTSIYSFVGAKLFTNNLRHGGPIWNRRYSNYNIGQLLNNVPAIEKNDHILLIPENEKLVAINLLNKHIIWNNPIKDYTNVAIAPPFLFTINDSNLEKRNIKTGELTKSLALNQPSAFPPLMTNKFIFISGKDSTWLIDTATLNISGVIPANGFLLSNAKYLASCNPANNEIKVFNESNLTTHTMGATFVSSVYPSICVNNIYLKMNDLTPGKKVSINLVDIKGKTISTFQFPVQQNELLTQINTSFLLPGSYFLQVMQDKNIQSHKFIKQ